jgi:aminoglycoside/choline kinase family phosphotransferase
VTFHRAGLQRNMQALGAFAFLSMHKGKHEFRDHIPAGIAALSQALAGFPEYPALAAVVAQAARALEKT